jgi:hypothetical protein
VKQSDELQLWDEECGESWAEHWVGMPEFVQFIEEAGGEIFFSY